jgi:lon-related putative ATP-dependent protease
MVERFIEEIARGKAVPADWCYVNNFKDPSRPNSVSLPAGQARQLQLDMKTLVEGAKRELRKAFESEEYAAKHKETANSFEKQAHQIIAAITAKAQEQGFFLQQTPLGILPVPLKDGQPLRQEEFEALSSAEKQSISQKQEAFQAEIEAAFRKTKNVERNAVEELDRLDKQVALYALSHLLDDLKRKYQGLPEVLAYLDEVRDNILDNANQFRADPKEQAAPAFLLPTTKERLFSKYSINVLVDNSSTKGAPVVMELNPTYNNLLGRIENEAQFGTLTTDFSLIRQGSLHRANGGYLVLPVEEVLRNPFSWDGLKRALRNRQIIIEDPSERLGFLTTRTLQPKPIPLDVKVVLIGQPSLYHLLLSYDEDFSELFKVKADFDSVMDRTDESIKDYAVFVSIVCSKGGLIHLDNTALAKIVEHGSRLAEDQTKLSTRFGELADVIREASYYAAQRASSSYVNAADIRKAIDEKFYRSGLIQERLKELTRQGTLMIDVEGEKKGQVNGLSVIDMGDIAFGHPTRITASIGVGREGLIDIEREAKLGGPTHTKGVLILAGYLMDKYAQDKPLSLSARLVFEQSYSGVEGDSASSTELYAILSALSGLPIKQSISVTGSVNQNGGIQAIGGVNEKIEGFFEVCKAKGLTGSQGVLIPASNEQNLMLKEEVLEAVKDGKFHIWSAKTIDEGIEILTGAKAGTRTDSGAFEDGTVNQCVDKRLTELAQTLVKFGKDEEEKAKEK